MTQFVLADTGPLYASVDSDDQHHDRAQSELSRLESDGIAVLLLYPTLMESYSLVMQLLGVRTAHTWLGELLAGATSISPSTEDYAAAVSTITAYADQRITLFDALLLVVSRRLEVSVWTYDHHLDTMRASVWR